MRKYDMTRPELVPEKQQIMLPDGRMMNATEVDFEVENEPWTVAKCSDGTTIRMKPNITKIFRMEEHDPINGDPAYFIQSGNIMRVQAPNSLKKFPKASVPTKPDGREIA